MENKPRREFLRKTLLGAGAAALFPGSFQAVAANRSALISGPSLPTRVLGRTGINCPLISMGTSGTTNPNFVRAVYDAGVKLFFSANYYGEGNNEILVGNGLKGLPRDSFLIATAAHPDPFDRRSGLLTAPLDADAFIKKAEASLKRFGLDFIDIFLLPYSSKKETVENEGILKIMDTLKKQGKVRYVGIATHGGTEEALKAAADTGVYDMAMITYNYKINNKPSLDTAVSYAIKAGMGVVAMKTTAGGAREKTGPQLNTDAALKWTLQNKNISSIVSGMTNTDELNKNLAMIQNLNMTDQEVKDLELAEAGTKKGLYCQQCKECIPQCPFQIDIPTVMRSYMYAYGYKNPEQAYHTLVNEAMFSGNPCDKCDVCNVHCTSGFDVKERIRDIARLQYVPKDFLMT
jgi:uncharacterized protein